MFVTDLSLFLRIAMKTHVYNSQKKNEKMMLQQPATRPQTPDGITVSLSRLSSHLHVIHRNADVQDVTVVALNAQRPRRASHIQWKGGAGARVGPSKQQTCIRSIKTSVARH